MKSARLHCPSCRRDFPLPPQQCPECGAQMILEPAKTGPSALAVILSLFLLLGPFGLGVLWRSDKFTRPAKWGLTVLVVAYTAVLVYAGYLAAVYLYQQVVAVTNALSSF